MSFFLVVHVESALDSIITSIPDLSIDPCPQLPSGLDELPPSERERKLYNLIPREKKVSLLEVVEGLGNLADSPSKPKLRGRKYNLSKAQLKAKLDIADGKQISLTGVLRVVQASGNVHK